MNDQERKRDQEQELADELDFLAAMGTYRAAREKGDAQAIADAEKAWREQVRAEMLRNERCR